VLSKMGKRRVKKNRLCEIFHNVNLQYCTAEIDFLLYTGEAQVETILMLSPLPYEGIVQPWK
jgi:hypothetical protein